MSEHPSPATDSPISRGRLEVLFDGIFAIAMTILVLELKVPELVDRHSLAELARSLRADAPTFISWLLSFSLLAVLWYRHNVIYRHVERVSRRMLVLQMLQLVTAAFIPFCAALIGHYPNNKLSMVLYSACVMVYLWAAAAYLMIAKRIGALSPRLLPAEYKGQMRRGMRGAVFVTAIFVYSLVLALTK